MSQGGHASSHLPCTYVRTCFSLIYVLEHSTPRCTRTWYLCICPRFWRLALHSLLLTNCWSPGIALTHCGSQPNLSATTGLGSCLRGGVRTEQSRWSGYGDGKKKRALCIYAVPGAFRALAASSITLQLLPINLMCWRLIIGSEATILTADSSYATCSNNIGASPSIGDSAYIDAGEYVYIYRGMSEAAAIYTEYFSCGNHH